MTAPDIYAELADLFGYREFRPFQEEVVRSVLAGRDSFTVMPTGGGKSLCYQLPARLLPGVCVVVSPLISLMKDQVDAAAATGLKAVAYNSAGSAQERERARLGLVSGDLDLVYISPERLAVPEFKDLLRRAKVSFFAIDEAHCISQWGHDFRPDYLALSALAEGFPKTPIAAFTATATQRVQSDIIERLGLRNPLLTRASFNRPNLFYAVTPKDKLDRQLLDFLSAHEGPGIIYRATRRDVEATAAFLNRHGLSAMAYHAGLPDAERRAAQEAFRQDRCPLLVATIAFGMGIDKPNVRFVLHGDLPKNIEGYYQETGRAGRDGEPAACAMFYGRKDVALNLTFASQIEDPAAREAALKQVYAMLDFTGRDVCRRKGLLAYFGEDYPEDNCGACDVCLGLVEREDATVAAQKLLSAMVRTGCSFGAQYVIDIVLGKTTPRIAANGHDRLPTFGCGGGHKADYWRRVADALLAQGLVRVVGDEYPVLVVTESGWEVLRGGRQCLMLRAAERKRGRKERRAETLAGAGDMPEAALEGEEDPELYALLREKRLELARAAGLPPFMIFADRTLRELARLKPASPARMLLVSGIGQHKLQTYGAEFLAAIAAWRAAQGESAPEGAAAQGVKPFSTEPISGGGEPQGDNPLEVPALQTSSPPEPSLSIERLQAKNAIYTDDASAPSGRKRGDSRRITADLLARGLSLAEVMEARGLKAISILRHMEELAAEGLRFEPAQFMRPERYAYICKLFKLCDDPRLTPVVERSKIEDALTAGQPPVDFDEARLARILMSASPDGPDSPEPAP